MARAGIPGNRLTVALAVLVAWVAVTLFSALLIYPQKIQLQDLVTRGIAWQILLASLLLLAVLAWFRWGDLGFRAPASGTLKLVWLPALILLALFVLAVLQGLPGPGVMLLLLVNCLMVGFSEEVMFRGVLFRALRARLRIWPAILWTTVAFGGIHVLNALLTGEFATAAVQAVFAACTGLLLMALLLRTGSLWVAILVHAAWDWVTFLLAVGATHGGAQAAPQGSALAASVSPMTLLIIVPNLLYALWLLRGVHRRAPEGDRPEGS